MDKNIPVVILIQTQTHGRDRRQTYFVAYHETLCPLRRRPGKCQYRSVAFHQEGAWQTCHPDGNTASVNLYIDERPPFAPEGNA